MNSEFKMNIPNQPLAGHSISIHIIIELNVLCCQTILNVASVLFHFKNLLFDAINTTFYTSYSALSSAHNLLRLRQRFIQLYDFAVIWFHSVKESILLKIVQYIHLLARPTTSIQFKREQNVQTQIRFELPFIWLSFAGYKVCVYGL